MKLFARCLTSKREISLLALAETALASGILLYLSFIGGWLHYFAVLSCVAPLALLRTYSSRRLGLKWFLSYSGGVSKFFYEFPQIGKNSLSRLFRRFPSLGVAFAFLTMAIFFFFIFPLAVLMIIPMKVAATIAGVVKEPLIALRRISQNWFDVVFRTDLTIYPEVVPGAERACREDKTPFGVGRWLEELTSERLGKDWIGFALVGPMIIVIYLCGSIYRWSLKSTACIFLPFVYLLQLSVPSGDNLSLSVKRLLESRLSLLLRGWSACVLLVNLVLPALVSSWTNAVVDFALISTPEGRPFIDFLLVHHGDIKAWHVAGITSALITFVIYFWADSVRIGLEHHSHSNRNRERRTLRKIQSLMGIRGVLACYTVFCGVYSIALTQRWVIPGIQWLPR